jgi:hypothetical protein
MLEIKFHNLHDAGQQVHPDHLQEVTSHLLSLYYRFSLEIMKKISPDFKHEMCL